MSLRLRLPFLVVVACGLVLAACAARPAPEMPAPPSPPLLLVLSTATAPARTPAAPTFTPPSAEVTPTPELYLEIAPPSPHPPVPFFLGVPAGDLYAPMSIAVDSEGGRAYVLGATSAGDALAISTVDLTNNEVLQVTPLPSKGRVYEGRVLVSPDGRRVYVIDRDAATLMLFDPDSGTLGPSLEGVVDAALSPDGKTLYTIGESVRAFDAAGLEAGRTAALWETPGEGFRHLALNGDALAAAQPAQPALSSFDAATGRLTGRVSLPDSAVGLAAAPDGGWAVRTGYSPRVLRFDRELQQVAETEAPYGDGLFYDALRQRYLVGGVASGEGAPLVIEALDAVDLKPLQRRPWPSNTGMPGESGVPGIFAAYGNDRILGVSGAGSSRLMVLDAETLEPTAYTVLGVRLTDMALDEVARQLYVADDQDRIRALSLPDGVVRHTWEGTAPIALDPANRRLYVNRTGGVVALDSLTGAALAHYPRKGMPAPDSHRDLVYITDQGVAIYDRAGHAAGRLDSTFPPNASLVPNPAAAAAFVNPITGYLAAVINNGVPGSSNRSYLQLYPPASDAPISVPGFYSFVRDLQFDRAGDLYASYSAAFNLEALQRLDGEGRETGRLGGRTGALAVDSDHRQLYVGQAGALALIDMDSMELKDLRRLPVSPVQMALDPGLGQLYVRPEGEPRIAALDLDRLEPFDFRPVAVSGLPADLELQALDFAPNGGQLTLYATTSTGDHYRARVPSDSDGADLRWEKLPVGSLPAWGQLTVSSDALFRVGEGSDGADGVFRSLDGGDTWTLIDAGLTDLRPTQPVAARSADEAYFVGKTGGVLAWEPSPAGSEAAGAWKQILAAEKETESPGQLSVAPDGALFLQSWGRLQRSIDRGVTWQGLPVPADSGAIAGFDPGYATNHTYFSLYCGSDACAVTRSRDAGQTQEQLFALPAYAQPLKLLTQPGEPPAGGPALYLYRAVPNDAQLYRSLDGGATWDVADPAALPGVTAMALAPDGRLWLGGQGTVRAVDPATFQWSPVPSALPLAGASAPPPARSPAPPPPPRNTAPAPTPCQQGLPDLGCPVLVETPVSIARQPFQRGRMIWVGPSEALPELQRSVLVLADGDLAQGRAAWQRFPDLWQEGDPASDSSLTAPEGLYQPVRGFGKVWRESLGGPQAAIGWATGPEQGLSGLAQRYEHGWVLRLADEQILLSDSGVWR